MNQRIKDLAFPVQENLPIRTQGIFLQNSRNCPEERDIRTRIVGTPTKGGSDTSLWAKGRPLGGRRSRKNSRLSEERCVRGGGEMFSGGGGRSFWWSVPEGFSDPSFPSGAERLRPGERSSASRSRTTSRSPFLSTKERGRTSVPSQALEKHANRVV